MVGKLICRNFYPSNTVILKYPLTRECNVRVTFHLGKTKRELRERKKKRKKIEKRMGIRQRYYRLKNRETGEWGASS